MSGRHNSAMMTTGNICMALPSSLLPTSFSRALFQVQPRSQNHTSCCKACAVVLSSPNTMMAFTSRRLDPITPSGTAGTLQLLWLANPFIFQETFEPTLIFCNFGKSKIDLLKFEPVEAKAQVCLLIMEDAASNRNLSLVPKNWPPLLHMMHRIAVKDVLVLDVLVWLKNIRT